VISTATATATAPTVVNSADAKRQSGNSQSVSAPSAGPLLSLGDVDAYANMWLELQKRQIAKDNARFNPAK
jgi:hypothetical protein